MTDMREDERERIGRLANEICGCSTLEQHRRDIALIEAEIDRRVAEERAKLLERLREAIKSTPSLTVDLIRQENYSGEHREWKEPITFPANARFYETVLEAVIEAMLAQFEKENSDEQR